MAKCTRWILPTIAFLACVLSIPPTWNYAFQWWGDQETRLDVAQTIPWSDRSQRLIERRYASSQNTFQIAITLLAGIWGLVVIGKEKVDRLASGWPERTVIILSTFMLAMSCWHGMIYTNMLLGEEYRAEQLGISPDITSPLFSTWFAGQQSLLVFAALFLAASIVLDLWVFDGDESNETSSVRN